MSCTNHPDRRSDRRAVLTDNDSRNELGLRWPACHAMKLGCMVPNQWHAVGHRHGVHGHLWTASSHSRMSISPFLSGKDDIHAAIQHKPLQLYVVRHLYECGDDSGLGDGVLCPKPPSSLTLSSAAARFAAALPCLHDIQEYSTPSLITHCP